MKLHADPLQVIGISEGDDALRYKGLCSDQEGVRQGVLEVVVWATFGRSESNSIVTVT